VKSSDLRAKMADNGLIEGGFLSNGPLYTLLAMYMPLSVMVALLLLARTLLPVQFPLASIIASTFVSAVIASLYCDFMKSVKSRLLADIRGAIIILVVIYVLASVFRRELPFGWRFRPGIANLLPVIGALYAWCSVISLKQVFSARRHFEIYTELYQEECGRSSCFVQSAPFLRLRIQACFRFRRSFLFLCGFFPCLAVCLLRPRELMSLKFLRLWNCPRSFPLKLRVCMIRPRAGWLDTA